MRKFLLAPMILGLVAAPALATTQPGDMINILLLDQAAQTPEGRDGKQYTKAWKDLVMDAATKQKIAALEQKLEKAFATVLKVHAIRTNGATIDSVLFKSPYAFIGYQFGNGGKDHCTIMEINLYANSMHSGDCPN